MGMNGTRSQWTAAPCLLACAARRSSGRSPSRPRCSVLAVYLHPQQGERGGESTGLGKAGHRLEAPASRLPQLLQARGAPPPLLCLVQSGLAA